MKRPTSSLGRLGLVLMAGASLLGVGCGGPAEGDSPGGKTQLLIFAAASLTDAVQETGATFAVGQDVDLTYNFASSGALAQQILAAPRADVFLSASRQWMDAVEEGGHTVSGTRRTLLSNTLVVIAHPDAGWSVTKPGQIAGLPFRHFAIGDPDSVPAGQYARTWMESVVVEGGGSLWNAVEDRISPATDARAALAQVEGSADVVGVVYRTDYTSRKESVRLLHEIPPEQELKIEYPAALIKGAGNSAAARDFLEFLGGPEAAAIFAKHGFLIPSAPVD